MKKLNIEVLSENVKNRAESDIRENNICGASIAEYTLEINGKKFAISKGGNNII